MKTALLALLALSLPPTGRPSPSWSAVHALLLRLPPREGAPLYHALTVAQREELVATVAALPMEQRVAGLVRLAGWIHSLEGQSEFRGSVPDGAPWAPQARRAAWWRFADLRLMDDPGLWQTLATEDAETLAVALAGADPRFRDHVLGALSPAWAERLASKMAAAIGEGELTRLAARQRLLERVVLGVECGRFAPPALESFYLLCDAGFPARCGGGAPLPLGWEGEFGPERCPVLEAPCLKEACRLWAAGESLALLRPPPGGLTAWWGRGWSHGKPSDDPGKEEPGGGCAMAVLERLCFVPDAGVSPRLGALVADLMLTCQVWEAGVLFAAVQPALRMEVMGRLLLLGSQELRQADPGLAASGERLVAGLDLEKWGYRPYPWSRFAGTANRDGEPWSQEQRREMALFRFVHWTAADWASHLVPQERVELVEALTERLPQMEWERTVSPYGWLGFEELFVLGERDVGTLIREISNVDLLEAFADVAREGEAAPSWKAWQWILEHLSERAAEMLRDDLILLGGATSPVVMGEARQRILRTLFDLAVGGALRGVEEEPCV